MEISEVTMVISFGLLITLVLTIFIASFLVVSYKRKLRFKQHLQNLEFEKEQELLQTQLEIQEQTFKNISEEIHDNIGQVLSLVKLNLRNFGSADDENVQDTKILVSKAIVDLRNLSRSMHGDRISSLGLQAAAADELQMLQRSKAFNTELNISGTPYRLEAQQEIVLFRIVQEALNNAVKYSKASLLAIAMNYEPQIFTLVISDDGSGFDTGMLSTEGAGIGLTSMKNRAKLIDASIAFQSVVGQGTRIVIQTVIRPE